LVITDSDTTAGADISLLWDIFNDFTPDQQLGIASEQDQFLCDGRWVAHTKRVRKIIFTSGVASLCVISTAVRQTGDWAPEVEQLKELYQFGSMKTGAGINNEHAGFCC
jgi:hypothetical protein